MVGTLIISLDCEGKWGMADQAGPQFNWLTEAKLVAAYDQILSAFAAVNFKATFAFVGAFTLTEKERADFGHLIVDSHYHGQNWLRNYRQAEAAKNTDGWFCPDGFSAVKAAGHEIACHTFSHLPFNDPDTPEQQLRAELQSAKLVAEHQGVALNTFVFPRNAVARTDLLSEFGFKGYRMRLAQRNRVLKLMREAHIFDHAQEHGTRTGNLVGIPAGYFFNSRIGVRKNIPKSVTVARWGSVFRSAARQGKVAHLTLHPHNLINGSEALEVLEAVLEQAAKMRDAGQLSVVTQEDYVSRFQR